MHLSLLLFLGVASVAAKSTLLPGFPSPADRASCISSCEAERGCALYLSDSSGICTLYSNAPPGSTPVVHRAYKRNVALVGGSSFTLQSSTVSATLSSASGLTALNISGAPPLFVQSDSWAAALDAVVIESGSLGTPAGVQIDAGSVSLTYTSGIYTIVALYEVRDGWHFVRKTLSFSTSTPASAILVNSVAPFDVLLLQGGGALGNTAAPNGDGTASLGLFARFGDGSGILATASNPFVVATITQEGGSSVNVSNVHVGYLPNLWFNQTTAAAPTPSAYVSDGGILGSYMLSPNYIPPIPGAIFSPSWLNYAERDAFRAAAEAHFILPPKAAPRIHIPWTENDYQIDTSTPSGFDEYVRVLTQLSRFGIERILYAASNSEVSSYSNCTDDWCWEPVLWLNMGEDVRAGRWNPSTDPLPQTVQALVDAGASLNVSLVPYAYPILGFVPAEGEGPASPPWFFPSGQKGKVYSNLGNRDFQDYMVDLMVNFSISTKAYGAGYDYTYFYDPNSSQFSQWSGWRRILTNIRTRLTGPALPDYIVDNRQLSHAWSPWMWAAGSYAEPLQSDEQTTSWTAYVQDLHIDRTDANRQRQQNYDYAQNKLCQPSAMPGFFSHNTDRACGGPLFECNVRDYDYYGTPYGILSAVATGAANMVVNLIPARDLGEFTAFPDTATYTTASVAFYRSWLDFARDNRALLLNTKPFPVPPAPGVIDGTYAISGNSGYIFLFNPNSRALQTPPNLIVFDADNLDIVCSAGDVFSVSEVWPVIAADFTTVPCGGNFSIAVEGRNALVLSIAPISSSSTSPRLDAAAQQTEKEGVAVQLLGRQSRSSVATLIATEAGSATAPTLVLRLPQDSLSDASTPPGTHACASSVAPLYALIPTSSLGEGAAADELLAVLRIDLAGRPSASITWEVISSNSRGAASFLSEATSADIGCWPTPRSFSPAPVAPAGFVLIAIYLPTAPLPVASFAHSSPVTGMGFNPAFSGGILNGTVRVPAAAFAQLATRTAAYPVNWTETDLGIAWLAPGRLLLYVDAGGLIPSGVTIPATLNGVPIPVQEVFSCRTGHEEMCFQQYWIDLTAAGVLADTDYSLSLTLPSIPGQNYGPRTNWDMPNGDLPNMPITLNSSSSDLCWALCNQTSDCVAWAYGEPGAGCEPAPHCWLKATVEPCVQRTCRVSGLQPGQGTPALFQGVYYDNIDSIYTTL